MTDFNNTAKPVDKPLPINGTIYWANTTTPNKMSGKYQFDLCNLSDAAAEALEQRGIRVRSNPEKRPEQGRYITMKSKNPIRAYNTSGDEITDVLIGNESTATVRVGYYDWSSPSGQRGRSPSCAKLTIRDLVVFESDGSGGGDATADIEAAL